MLGFRLEYSQFVDIMQQADTAAAGSLLGLEMEMVVAHKQQGSSGHVNRYFAALAQRHYERGQTVTPLWVAGRCAGIQTEYAVCGLDNGLNLLETALYPVSEQAGGLHELARRLHQELADTLCALHDDNLVVLNASQHPDCPRDEHWYAKTRVPRPIYDELQARGCRHDAGIDAKAQNGANTAIPIALAIKAVNVGLALIAPVSIALFGNSPLESGRPSGLKETRLTIWPRMFGPSLHAGDAHLCRYPSRPFRNLADYFFWMFGPPTVSRSLSLNDDDDYKSGVAMHLEGSPSLHAFLHADAWPARRQDTGALLTVQAQTRHFVHAQVLMLLDARLRYRLVRMPDIQDLREAWKIPDGMETLLSECGVEAYLEGRAAGANFADAVLLDHADTRVASSIAVAPSALQLGLLRQLPACWALIEKWGWERLGKLREVALREGVAHAELARLCDQVLALAYDGLHEQESRWLRYADYVLSSGQNGADRLLQTWNSRAGASRESCLQRVVQRHAAIHPNLFFEG